ncbi:guanine deaminase [Aquincola sp. S2]|uniref:Guanine deaminase n=1 Tax=Pseudaquabacterium terrae TaxID=2732868 RepID=A0ABX2EEL2_9BURK|nr:guanine deaminase [Aquabacterium terrae]NRF67048.1 guanine deaminase [Aquabacterium terrae]
MTSVKTAVRADLLDFTADPGLADLNSPAVRFRPDHWLLTDERGRIAAVQPHEPGDDFLKLDRRGQLLLPGFIDTHVHCPQIDVIASWGAQLLDWLETYTFPAEARHAEPEYAAAGAKLFLDALLSHGTTSAVVFPTVHRSATEALFDASTQRGMRIIAGKVLMDRHAPDNLRDDVDGSEMECRALIKDWHGRGRIAYALTPRFAATSSDAQLAMAGRLLAEHPGVYMQTHVAENPAEVRWIAELFPSSRSYLDVYASHGLLTERSVLAHGIWLDDLDRALLHDSGAQIAHCPSSNLFLGSGLFGWREAREAGFNVSLGSDVGGGTSLSMHRTMADGYKVQALAGTKLSAWALLHAATRAAAVALRLPHEIGFLEPGCAADFCVWDWAVGSVAERRHSVARELHEKVFAWITLGDERNLVESWVGGLRRYQRI